MRNQVGHRRIGRSPQAKWAEETGLLKELRYDHRIALRVDFS